MYSSVREATVTAPEFERMLRQVEGVAVSGALPEFIASDAHAALSFHLSPLPDMVFPSFRLTRWQVRVNTVRGGADAATQLLQRIDRSMQRGGG